MMTTAEATVSYKSIFPMNNALAKGALCAIAAASSITNIGQVSLFTEKPAVTRSFQPYSSKNTQVSEAVTLMKSNVIAYNIPKQHAHTYKVSVLEGLEMKNKEQGKHAIEINPLKQFSFTDSFKLEKSSVNDFFLSDNMIIEHDGLEFEPNSTFEFDNTFSIKEKKDENFFFSDDLIEG
jgi:hypothetical protein